MTLAFDPVTEDEIQEMKLLPEGIYDFTIKKADEKYSKAGNQMLELILDVYDSKGHIHQVWDYIVPSTNMIYKLKHLCDSIGLGDKYKTGMLDYDDVQRKSGKAKIIIQKGNINPNGGLYPDKNAVIDYLMKNNESLKSEKKESQDFNEDQDIPF